MRVIEQVSNALITRRRVVIPVLLLVLLAVGAGVPQLEQDAGFQAFDIGTEAEQQLEYVDSNFDTAPDNQTVAQVVVKDEDVLDKETLLTTLAIQRDIRTNETVDGTLRADQPTVGIANVIARAAIRQRHPNVTNPSLERQQAALEAMNERQIDAIIAQVLDANGRRSDALALMPEDYESGSGNATATMIVVFQHSQTASAPGNAPDGIVRSQRAIQHLSEGSTGVDKSLVVGSGIITDEQRQSRQDTLKLLGPLALVFVLATLVGIYRDVVDVALSLVGIVLVQIWTFGMLGWTGIAFNPVLIAIPVLLIGLSIDYGIHVFMRYREHRAQDDEGIVAAMQAGLGGVGVALLWVTVTTVVGFLSNVASPVRPIRDIGLISAIGIVGAFIVFGLFIPPVKVELEGLLKRAGLSREQQPVGTGGGRTATLLAGGAKAAKKAPVIVIALTLIVTAVTTAGATQVSTSFEPEDNIAKEAPAWTDSLPEALQPEEYTVRENLEYVNERFVRPGSQAEILVRGNMTEPDTLEDVRAANAAAATKSTTDLLANGEPQTRSPLSVMERVAAENEPFNRAFVAADTDGDGVPDSNLTALYDRLYQVAPDQARSVLHREEGDYVAARMTVVVNAGARGEAVTTQMRSVAGVMDGGERVATATGDPIVNQRIQDYLLRTLLTSLFITLVVILTLLIIVYRVVHGSATLGVITLLPVLFVVSWVIGTMYLLDYPLSVLTTIIASITIGIGIDYSIHISERFQAELETAGTVVEAITTATRGTGSALLGSALTTAIGFGILGFAFFPVLQQFGTITAIMIVYAFLASVLVLPSILVLWARYVEQTNWTVTEGSSIPVESGNE